MTYERDVTPRSGRERTQRQLRVGELIRHSLVEILTRDDLRDPNLSGVSITISEVRVSPDLKNATAYIMPLGGRNIPKILAALKRAAPYLRRRVGASATMRYMPTLSFVEDRVFDEGEKIATLLRSSKVSKDLTTGSNKKNSKEN
ncbi:MAG: 30S ribosome-binding factor RbfA [Pseudomonadota bacterium]|nr:30S ribosome-binding factor RbfA [Pseudomonadota bacterium]